MMPQGSTLLSNYYEVSFTHGLGHQDTILHSIEVRSRSCAINISTEIYNAKQFE